MENKEITIKESIKDLIPLTNKIDAIVNECLPIVAAERQGISEALVLAKGIHQLREIFRTDKNIKATILSLENTNLGFLTDRTPEACIKSNLKPYSYEQISECCLEALLKGYRLTDKEFCIIAGNFYGAKNGRYRKIIETEGLTDFTYANSTPIFKMETRLVKKLPAQVQYAEVQCYASWKMNGKNQYIGHHPKNKDTKDELIFKIKANEYMGDDGVVGKALSKLFGRVLSRISGKLVDESTDMEFDEPKLIGETSTAAQLTQKIIESHKEQPKKQEDKKPAPKKEDKKSHKITDVKRDPHSEMGKAPTKEAILRADLDNIIKSFGMHGIDELEICAYYGVDDIEELNCEMGLNDLRSAISDIESGNGNLTPEQFKSEGAERVRERFKSKENNKKPLL